MKTLLTFLLLAFSSLIAFPVDAAKDVIEFKSKQEEDLYRELILELRCPKCQNQNIADSNAVVAKDMRNKTIELVNQGKSRQEVIDYMVNRYGQFAHYRPPMNVATSMLWLLPLSFVLLAIFLLWRRSRASANRAQADTTINEAQDSELASLDSDLDALLKDPQVKNEQSQSAITERKE